MAYISFQPSDFFNTVLYTGNASDRTISGVGFQPDWVWIKNRSASYNHGLFDSNRGANLRLSSSTDGSEVTYTESLTAFNSDGFDLGDNSDGNNTVNNNSENYVAWNWKANAGTTSSNTDGSITSTVQTGGGGFSIVSYTGNGTAGATIGHSLGKVPKMIIVKNRDTARNWRVYESKGGATKFLSLNLTNAQASATTIWNNTEPTSSVVTLGSDESVNENGSSIIAYCFADVKGYSKFGSYTGNGSTDGTFVYTGFRPAFVICKRTNDVGYWVMFDDARQPENENDSWLLANDSSNEGINSTGMDFISNGFKLRNSSTGGVHNNISGSTYIYMAFAEFPLVGSNGLAGTAR